MTDVGACAVDLELAWRAELAEQLLGRPGRLADAVQVLDGVAELLEIAEASAPSEADSRRLALARDDVGSLVLAATWLQGAGGTSEGVLRRAVATVRGVLDGVSESGTRSCWADLRRQVVEELGRNAEHPCHWREPLTGQRVPVTTPDTSGQLHL